MPAPPAEVVAEFSIGSRRGDSRAIEAALQSARASGLALEAGPQETALAGGRSEVVAALGRVIESALRSSEQRCTVPFSA